MSVGSASNFGLGSVDAADRSDDDCGTGGREGGLRGEVGCRQRKSMEMLERAEMQTWSIETSYFSIYGRSQLQMSSLQCFVSKKWTRAEARARQQGDGGTHNTSNLEAGHVQPLTKILVTLLHHFWYQLVVDQSFELSIFCSKPNLRVPLGATLWLTVSQSSRTRTYSRLLQRQFIISKTKNAVEIAMEIAPAKAISFFLAESRLIRGKEKEPSLF